METSREAIVQVICGRVRKVLGDDFPEVARPELYLNDNETFQKAVAKMDAALAAHERETASVRRLVAQLAASNGADVILKRVEQLRSA